jgi:hypothetical protein
MTHGGENSPPGYRRRAGGLSEALVEEGVRWRIGTAGPAGISCVRIAATAQAVEFLPTRRLRRPRPRPAHCLRATPTTAGSVEHRQNSVPRSRRTRAASHRFIRVHVRLGLPERLVQWLRGRTTCNRGTAGTAEAISKQMIGSAPIAENRYIEPLACPPQKRTCRPLHRQPSSPMRWRRETKPGDRNWYSSACFSPWLS